MQSAVMQSIVLLIVLLCFQVELDWLTKQATALQLCRSRWPYVEVCRSIASYCTRKSATYTSRTLETFGWPANESLGALSLRNNDIDAHFQADCRVVLPSLAEVCKAQTHLFKWSPLQCNVNRNKLPGDSLKSNWCQTGQASRVCCGHGTLSRLLLEDERIERLAVIELCTNWK